MKWQLLSKIQEDHTIGNIIMGRAFMPYSEQKELIYIKCETYEYAKLPPKPDHFFCMRLDNGQLVQLPANTRVIPLEQTEPAKFKIV